METRHEFLRSGVGTYTLEVVCDDLLGDLLARTGRPYEEVILRLVNSLTSPGDHIVDVGAHLGNHSVYWALSGRRVSAFEPNPPVAEILERNVRANGLAQSVTISPLALGARGGAGRLVIGDAHNLGEVSVEPDDHGPVEVARLDDLDLDQFSILKVDVEGHEAEVLAGATATLERHRPYVVAEALDGAGSVTEQLHPLGYRRLLPSLTRFPRTFLYAPSVKAASRAVLTRPYWTATIEGNLERAKNPKTWIPTTQRLARRVFNHPGEEGPAAPTPGEGAGSDA
ncbi:MAG: FkbM family methyltransferase [Acidimicrobiales bacterium]|nr:FkbM family methyltransferase [Acidimicrobiales bacterium]